MIRDRTRTTALVLGMALVLAACAAAPSPSSSAETTAASTVTASTVASPSMEPSATPRSTATPEPTGSPSPGPIATSQPQTGGGFTITAHPEADALFAERDECQNLQDGYQLIYPDEWYTNTEIRGVPACSWFSPVFYAVANDDELPAEIAIEIFWLPGERDYQRDPISRDEGMVGGQAAARVEVSGTADDPEGEGTTYEYAIALGPPDEAGPTLVARTDTDMGGDYELNKAVLDRVMATMEFIGSIQ